MSHSSGAGNQPEEGEFVDRVCFLARVRTEPLAEYRERHEHVWAEMRDAMGSTDVNRRWQAEMAGYFVSDSPPDKSFSRIAEIFHLD
jgi:L-rhamnose mutarotase